MKPSELKPDYSVKKKVLITGAGSYIGEAFKKAAGGKYPETFTIDTLDMLDPAWRDKDFSGYDIVYHVAGIAHADVGNVSEETREKYYAVNTDLAVEVCKKAKVSGVGVYAFMSSMIVYGESAPVGKKRVVTRDTVPTPANFYGDSKLQADVAVRSEADESFTVLVFRPPMIYGEGCKGNYRTLEKLAMKLPVFPGIDNERSMINIDMFTDFLCRALATGYDGGERVFMPQDPDYGHTALIVRDIAIAREKKIRLWGCLNPFVRLAALFPGKIGGLVGKAFGNFVYDRDLSD